jgi:O-antigen/teichoic acid export membrane protein
MKSLLKEKILHSGLIFTAISLVTGVGNFIFLKICATALGDSGGEFGAFGQTTTFVGLLGLPLLMASTAIVHHIAHFRGANNEARLQGLLVGCRSFLLKLTIAGCIIGALLIQPLSYAFDIPRRSLTIAALASLIIALWSGYASALAQGMGWFKRLALIGLAVVAVKLVLVWTFVSKHPVAETCVLAASAGTLITLAVFFWWRDLFKPGERISPWDRDFFRYLAVAAAGVGAQWCFTQSDMQVVGNYFAGADKDAYYGAVRIASALHLAVSPLLIVLFTARSSERASRSLSVPLGLLLLYAMGLATGALVLFFARDICIQFLFKRPFPEASAMIGPLAITMIFVGLIQALGMWALASHWLRMGVLFGGLGLGYWGVLLGVARQSASSAGHIAPSVLLKLMPTASGIGFVVMLIAWLIALRKSRRAPAVA